MHVATNWQRVQVALEVFSCSLWQSDGVGEGGRVCTFIDKQRQQQQQQQLRDQRLLLLHFVLRLLFLHTHKCGCISLRTLICLSKQ